MNLSFREKSLWIQATGLVVAFGLYFWQVRDVPGPDVGPGLVGLFIAVVVLLVLFQVVGHAVAAMADRRTEPDERDRRISLVGDRMGGLVLGCAVFASLCVALAIPGNFAFTHVLLAGWVAAELAGIATQIVLQRRGA
ncbi:MAG TPA: hypothetical protein PLD37_08985 [Usitatibacteraceae bacterium]|nr:hypothetical protein [Usitatibacteraceae bacterium]